KKSHRIIRTNSRSIVMMIGVSHENHAILETVSRAPLKIGIRRLFASGPSPTGKIFGGYLQVATLKSSCIVLLVHALKIHPIEFLEIPSMN
ncbi:MAG: hypothetical protein IKQ82_09255, partial [Lentisphaeria bacterium]|nr:hypothetical protein [Lentisphaeria bacterium]